MVAMMPARCESRASSDGPERRPARASQHDRPVRPAQRRRRELGVQVGPGRRDGVPAGRVQHGRLRERQPGQGLGVGLRSGGTGGDPVHPRPAVGPDVAGRGLHHQGPGRPEDARHRVREQPDPRVGVGRDRLDELQLAGGVEGAEERAHRLDGHVAHRLRRGDQHVRGSGGGQVHHEVVDRDALVALHDVDGQDVRALAAEGRRDRAEGARPIGEHHSQQVGHVASVLPIAPRRWPRRAAGTPMTRRHRTLSVGRGECASRAGAGRGPGRPAGRWATGGPRKPDGWGGPPSEKPSRGTPGHDA